MTSNRKVDNKRARFDYDITETIEAGLVLNGSEIKSFRAGQASLNGTFVRPLSSGPKDQIELWLLNSHFTNTPDPDRSRKLLVQRKMIDRLIGKVQEKSMSIIPLEMYLRNGRLKVLIGLGRGKKQFEKRETIKQRDINREIRREIR